jgi:glycosyltransferase involved in cell wall biosynthesis
MVPLEFVLRVSPVRPKFSIITPSFNCARYLRECIESVLRQGEESFEHIIMDGGSSDETVEILKSYPHLIWSSERDKGEGDALNKALQRAKGEIVYWLNADDIVQDNVFALVEREIRAGADVVYGKTLIIDDSGAPVGLRIPKAPLSVPVLLRWFQHLHISQPSMFIKRQVFEEVGGFNPDLFFSIDLELWLRIAEGGFSFASVDHVLSKARLIRSDAKSAASRESQEENWLSVSRPFLARLARIERVNFWKDYYLFFTQQNQGKPLSPSADPDELVGLGLALSELGISPQVARVLDQIYGALPNHPDVIAFKAEVLRGQGEFQQAAELAQKALTIESHQRGALGPVAPPPRRDALIFFPHQPYPPQSGAHVRALSYLHGLQEHGYSITWIGAEQFSDTEWSSSSIRRFEGELGVKARYVKRSPEDEEWASTYGTYGTGADIKWRGFSSPGIVRAVTQARGDTCPDLFLVNYAFWGDIARGDDWGSTKRILEMHDLVTVGSLKSELLKQALRPVFRDDSVALERLTREDFFDSISSPDLSNECAQCDHFDAVVAISPQEFVSLSRGVVSAPVAYIPGGVPVSKRCGNTYSGSPVFLMGPNNFNLQGYLYLAMRVLPRLRMKIPTATFKIIGKTSVTLPEIEGLERLGYVENILPLYEQAPFAICPLLGGTGMQIKIVEAMAHGVPVIALKNVAESSPLEHGRNGFIASNGDEFAGFAAMLLRDRALCREMGREARETVVSRFSQEAFTKRLSDLLATASAHVVQRSAG